MKVRFLIIFLALVGLTGCMTTQKMQPQPEMQVGTQISDLEQRLGEQEKEIVDLKYEVKDLASRLEMQQVVSLDEGLTASPRRENKKQAVSSSSSSRSSGTLRVDAEPKKVQQALKAAGVYDGKLDGVIGPMTKTAVQEFQKQHGLKPDGVVGRKTWYELELYLE